MRVGIGYDVHAFAAAGDGRTCIIGGVVVPHERGLIGHSDADVLTHAIADALLGALREGDIGKLFPDTDARFKDADSLELLAIVGKLVAERGYRIVDIDSVVVAQVPKIAPHREAMRARIADALGIAIDTIGVKATTTERLGFEGREEGIGAHAVALLTKRTEEAAC
ncbi:MAG: 2-C-methyl-D-erythritol 2,4-cyclodiphosphate synthase [Coriobacteriia bacterium]|nr:2-C-methyl-D-erythritol 2,4-cyclodiphosphate synthase [Coriobacteriia bacterium]